MSINYFQNSAESAESRVKLMSDEIMELRISLESAERSLMVHKLWSKIILMKMAGQECVHINFR